MKKLLFLATLLSLAAVLRAQTYDTAATVVDSYLTLLNYDALPKDSTLVLHTTVTYQGATDTFYMTRYYAREGMMRIEVRNRQDELVTGLCTNGKDRYREYSRHLGWWEDKATEDFNYTMQNYDFRGPLHDWRQHEIHLTYNGTSTVEGHTMQVVIAEQPKHYTRYYMFDTESHLLTLIFEKDTTVEGKALLVSTPIDWKVIHEYLPVHGSLVVSEESFLRDGLLTIMRTTATFIKREPLLFNQD